MRNSLTLLFPLLLCIALCGCSSKQADTAPAPMQASMPSADESVRPHVQSASQVLSQTEAELEADSRGDATDGLDDYDESPSTGIADPLEPWNRMWFHFNDFVYTKVARPLYRGYDFIMPDPFQSGLRNFLSNLLFPVRFVNCLLQGKVQAAGVEYGRFIVNTFVGFGGFIDVAKGKKTVVPVDSSGEDLGQTFGSWGIGEGCYIVWPLIGPSNLRDSVGLVGDSFLNPSMYLNPGWVPYAVNAPLRFNSLGEILPLYDDVSNAAVDPYVSMREAYVQYRRQHITQ